MDLLTTSVRAGECSGEPYTLVSLAGEADATNSEQLREVLESQASGQVRTLIVDLSELKFMDSSALRVLLQCNRMIDREGGTLGLVRPQGSVARILRFTRADQLVPVFDSVEEAAAR